MKKKSTEFLDAEFYAEYFEKKSFKKIKYSRSSPDLEDSQCAHFADFQTLPDNSGKPNSVDSKKKN